MISNKHLYKLNWSKINIKENKNNNILNKIIIFVSFFLFIIRYIFIQNIQ